MSTRKRAASDDPADLAVSNDSKKTLKKSSKSKNDLDKGEFIKIELNNTIGISFKRQTLRLEYTQNFQDLLKEVGLKSVKFKDYKGEWEDAPDYELLSNVGILDGGIAIGKDSQEYKVVVEYVPNPAGKEGTKALSSLALATPCAPIVGSFIPALKNLLDFVSTNAYSVGRKDGLFGLKIGSAVNVVVCSPKTVRAVLDNVYDYKKGFAQTVHFNYVMGNGLFNSSGKLWSLERTLSTKFYQWDFIASQQGKINSIYENFFNIWDDQNSSNFVAGDTVFDVFLQIENAVLDCVTATLMGQDFGCIDNLNSNPIANAIQDSISLLKNRKPYALFPFLDQLPIPGNVLYHTCIDLVKGHVKNIIQNRRSYLNQLNKLPTCVLDIMLLTKDNDGNLITDELVLDELMSSLYSAQNPTSVAVAWTVYEIARNPEIQKNLKSEILSVVGDDKEPSFETALFKLPYLSRVVNESLRLHPVAPILSRATCNDTTLEGYKIPANTQFLVPTWALHRDPELWKDANTFNPDRFKDADINPYAFFPFGSGPRDCVGYSLASTITKTFVIKLLQRFDVSLPTPTTVVEPFFSITLFPAGGIPVKISRDYSVAPGLESLPQNVSPEELVLRGEQLAKRRAEFQVSDMIHDREAVEKLGTNQMPPYVGNYTLLDVASNKDNMPVPDTMALITGVLKAKVSVAAGAAKGNIAGIVSDTYDSIINSFNPQPTPQVEDVLDAHFGTILDTPLLKIPERSVVTWIADDREVSQLLEGTNVKFGRQRVAGQHPCALRRWKSKKELPFKLPEDTPEIIVKKINKSFQAEKLFYVDYSAVSVEKTFLLKGTFLCTPIALFEVDENNDLMPLGIYFFKDREIPLFVTPLDDPKLWLLAKIYASCADVHYQQFIHHLPLTHCVSDSIIIAYKWSLPEQHPIYKLLDPHFRGTLEINFLARNILLAKGGLIDQTLACSRIGALALTSKTFNQFNFKKRALEYDLEERGVGDTKILPNYPYRDYGRLLNNEYRNFNTDIVNIYYKDDNEIQKDGELQNFARAMNELFKAHQPEGHDSGIPPYFKTKTELIEFLTNLMFTVSVQHSILNYADLVYHGFVPNAPTMMHVDFPSSKNVNLTVQDFIRALPTIKEGLKIVAFSTILSNPPLDEDTIGLSDMLARYNLKDIGAREAIRKHQERLRGVVTSTITEMNAKFEASYGIGYPYMLPSMLTYGLQI